MALVKSGSLGVGSPLMAYELHATQTAGTGTKRTIKVTLKAKCGGSTSASFYGYPATYYFKVNGTKTTTATLKSSARWYGNEAYRTFTATVTVDVGTTSSKAIPITVTVASSSGGDWNGTSPSANFTVGSTNTAPVWASGSYITIRQTNSSGTVIAAQADGGTENAKKFPENIGSLYLSWNKPTDKEGGTLTYEIYEQVNNGSWAKIATTTTNAYTRSIGSGSSTQGKMYDYYVKVKDSGGLYASGSCGCTQIQKNQLTVASPSAGGSISYATKSFTINWSGAKNTNGNTSFTYNLSSSHITVYNQKVSGSSATVTIWRTGDATPTGCYVKFDDIKNYLSGSSYKGNISFTLKTANAYGSSGTKSVNVSTNIQTNPTSFSFGSVSGTSTINSVAYLIPANKQTTITWDTSSDPLGTAIKYDVYYSYNNGSTYTILQSNVTTNILTKSLPSISSEVSCKFKITAKTAYGKTTSVTSGTYTLHYVSSPTLKLTLQRNQTTYEITGTATIRTSIPNIELNSISYKIGTSTTVNTITIANPFTISGSLAEDSTESITVTVLDQANSELGKTGISQTINIGKYNPMFSIREKGVGVNTINTGNTGKYLVVNGGINVLSNGMVIDSGGLTVTAGATSFSGSTTANGSLTVGGNTTLNGSGTRLEITSADLCSSGDSKLDINTSGDSSGVGNGRTLIGYNNNGKYNHYFRGSGTTYLDTVGGTVVTSTLLTKGEATFNDDVQLEVDKAIYFNKDTDARIGYSKSGSCVYIANSNANWLRLSDEGNMTWKGVGVVLANCSTQMTGDLQWTAGATVQANNGIAVLRSNSNDITYCQGSALRVTAPKTSTTYRPVLASAFTVSSQTKYKQDIVPIEEDKAIDSMEILKSTGVYTYRLKDEIENGVDKKKIGLIVEQATCDLTDYEEEGIDLYQMASTLWDVCKKQQEKIEQQEFQINELRELTGALSNQNQGEN